MQIFDTKALLGIIGTLFSGIFVWFQETLMFIQQAPESQLSYYIPLIPAIPTAIYMGVKAYNAYMDGKMRRQNND